MTAQGIKKQLDQARQELAALELELPNFHSLLTDNEQAEAELRRNKAPLDKLAQAKGRVTVARELLEQHQADIGTARAEVQRLEGALQRETTLERMTEAAREASKHRKAFNAEITKANDALRAHLQKLLQALDNITAARQAFTQEGRQLAEAFTHMSLPGGDIKTNQIRDGGEAVLKELKERGAPIDDVLAIVGWRLSAMDREPQHNALATPEPYARPLWNLINEAQQKRAQEAQAQRQQEEQNRRLQQAREREEERRRNNYEITVDRWHRPTVEDLVFPHANHFRYTGPAEQLATWTIPKAGLPDGFIENLKKQLPYGATIQ